MKRYNSLYSDWFGELKLHFGMVEHPQGDYVRYEREVLDNAREGVRSAATSLFKIHPDDLET